jgi:geranylgeranyl diphosphate synthase type I
VATSPAAPDPARLGEVRREVGNALTTFLAGQRKILSGIGPELDPSMDAIESLLAGGKRLRAAFCYWGWRAAGGEDCPPVFAAAAALELLQASALVHDDVIDASDTRRGLPSVHQRFVSWHAANGLAGSAERFGAGTAIILGDLLLTWANSLYADSGFAASVLRNGAGIWGVLQTELAAGQLLDLLSQVSGTTSVATALRVISYKTTKYTIERPLQLGAALATATAGTADTPVAEARSADACPADPAAIAAAFSRYGIPLGLAFQLRDDVLGVFGDPVRTGKPVSGDISEGKRTVLMALAKERATPAQAAILDRHVGDRGLTEAGAAAVRAVVRETGALAECEDRIAAYRKEAVAALDGAPITAESRSALAVLGDLVTDREELGRVCVPGFPGCAESGAHRARRRARSPGLRG